MEELNNCPNIVLLKSISGILSLLNCYRFQINNNNKVYCSINETLKFLISKILESNSYFENDIDKSNYYHPIELKQNKIIATGLINMFYGCSSLLSILGLSNFDTTNVTNMQHLFDNCSKLKK